MAMRLVLGFFLCMSVLTASSVSMAVPAGNWAVMNTVAYPGKQDDIFFINRKEGWYVNGAGYIYHSTDGGENWTESFHQPGTYFRSINFVNDKIGFAGNIGPDYFPGVTDSQPLYQTLDGGKTWTAVVGITPGDIKGVCALDSMTTQFINAGKLETRTTIYAAGRVGGPAKLVISRDGGQSWSKYDLTKYTGMVQDVKFINESTGFICAGSDPSVEKSHAQILKTTDGGTTWKVVYESTRPLELIWKCSFPTDKVGYATVLSYDDTNAQKYVAKTVDGGETWQDLPLAVDANLMEFGVGFLNENIGWVGAMNGVWQTTDGGQTWQNQPVGTAINKIRIAKDGQGTSIFGIGVEVIKMDLN